MNTFIAIAFVALFGIIIISTAMYVGNILRTGVYFTIIPLVFVGILVFGLIGYNIKVTHNDAKYLKEVKHITGLNVTHFTADKATVECTTGGDKVTLKFLALSNDSHTVPYVKDGTNYILLTPEVMNRIHPGLDCSTKE